MPKKKQKRKISKPNKAASKRKAAKKSPKPAKRKTTSGQSSVKKKAQSKPSKTTGSQRGERKSPDESAFQFRGVRSRSAVESGDLQGISRSHLADSESVEELLEEGNAFEADVIAGVEAADDSDEQEVHTHEVPEDDVPREYLDEK